MNAADNPREQQRMRKETGDSTSMTTDASKPKTAPAELITDFETLYSRQTGFNSYRVLNTAGGQPTAYQVDTAELSCGCMDEKYNREDGEVCKHLAYALFNAPQTRSVEDFAVQDLSISIGRLSAVLDDAESVSSPEPQPDSPETTEANSEPQAASQSEPEPEGDVDLIKLVNDWMGSYVRHWKHLDLEERDHDGTHGVKVEIDYGNINDTQKDQIKEDLKGPDGVQHHTGFLDGGCKVCGAEDDNYWIFYPASTVRGLPA